MDLNISLTPEEGVQKYHSHVHQGSGGVQLSQWLIPAAAEQKMTFLPHLLRKVMLGPFLALWKWTELAAKLMKGRRGLRTLRQGERA